jgi:type I restriction enzyme, S subunit
MPSDYSPIGGPVQHRHLQRTVRSIWICLPPKAEQELIARDLTRQLETHHALEAKSHLAIDRLLEYRTALISAAVTGKIDVREAAQGISR